MGKNSNKNSAKEMLETTVKIASTVAAVGGAIITAIGSSKKQ